MDRGLPACRVCLEPRIALESLLPASSPARLGAHGSEGSGGGSLVQVLQGEGLCREADVAVAVEPHSKRVPVGHQEPLSQIKLSAKDEQGLLDILLHHPLAVRHHHGIAIHQLQHLLQAVHAHDAFRGNRVVRDQARLGLGDGSGDHGQLIISSHPQRTDRPKWVSLPPSPCSLWES